VAAIPIVGTVLEVFERDCVSITWRKRCRIDIHILRADNIAVND
jgi:hypothetical protein